MVFQKMSICKYLYDSMENTLSDNIQDKYGIITNTHFNNYEIQEQMADRFHENYNNIRLYLLCLSLCHSVINESKTSDQIKYQGCSPDEIALVNTARHLGFKFLSKTIDNQIFLLFSSMGIHYFINRGEYCNFIYRNRNHFITRFN